MSARTKKIRWLIPLVLGSVIVAGVLAIARPTRLNATPVCKLAEDWVQQNEAALPTSIAEFAPFSRPYRLAIYQALSPEQRVDLWREYLSPYVSATSSLTTEQRQLVQTFMDSLSVYVDGTEVARVAAQQARLPERFLAVFDSATAGRLLNVVSGLEQPSVEVGSPLGRLVKSWIPAVVAQRDVWCDCTTTEQWYWQCREPAPGSCTSSSGFECEPSILGCGPGNTMSCDGFCII